MSDGRSGHGDAPARDSSAVDAAGDRFAPPDAGGAAEQELQLARPVRRGSAAATSSAAAAFAAAPVEPTASPAQEALPEPIVGRRITYKNPRRVGNGVIWVVAAAGLAGLILVGMRLLKKSTEAKRAAAPATAAGPAPTPAKPVVWKAVQTGDAVLVKVEVVPRSAAARATLLLDGSPLPSNPVRLTRGASHTLSAAADGFEPVSQQLTATEATTVRLQLARARR